VVFFGKFMASANSPTAQTRSEWEDLAQLDPLWAILTDKERQFGAWNIQGFFASGQSEIDELMQSCGVKHGHNGRALDFGCGVGRLSRALQAYFAEVYGLDISEQMIRLAKEYTMQCQFLVNQTDNLQLFPSDHFDFVYSNIVLQHQRTRDIAQAYMREFVRVMKPQGTIVFQMPHRLSVRQALQPKRRMYSFLKSLGFSAQYLYNRLHLNPMRTICLSSKAVEETILSAGGRLLCSYSNSFHVHSTTYVVTKD
jgi:SAM-dependent methyltransferase